MFNVVGNGLIKLDPERVRPLQEFPPPITFKLLQRVLGMFAYYARWIHCFADKIHPLADVKSFPFGEEALQAFKHVKSGLENAALKSIDESKPFVVECDASHVAVSATLNQGERPVAFMSRTLQGNELKFIVLSPYSNNKKQLQQNMHKIATRMLRSDRFNVFESSNHPRLRYQLL